jgi:hypothetical protein
VILGIEAAHPPGAHDFERRHYALLVYAGCKNPERAAEIKRALFRSARRIGVSLSQCDIHKNGRVWDVHFRAACKECSRQYTVQRYGPDRAAWPYNPRRKANDDDRASWARFGRQ